MINDKMFIPETITAGYNTRSDTYTGQLAYVIYTDNKGVLRKETSWQSWRNHKLGKDDFKNEPTSGFVLNRGVGGNRMSYGWNTRNEYIRVYDPRNFEFEISLNNLLFILQETSSIKGKGLEGEFVYAWNGTELTLLPVDCQEYKECKKHTQRQSIKFDKKDIKSGYLYVMKDGSEGLYLGHHHYNNIGYNKKFDPVGRRHIFLTINKGKYEDYMAQDGFTKIAECISDSISSQYPDELEKFKKSDNCAYVKELKIESAADFMRGKNYEKTFFYKEAEHYIPVFESVQYNNYGWNWSSRNATQQYKYYCDKKGKFIPIIKNNALKVPNFSFKDREEIGSNIILYVIKIQTIADKEFYI